MKTIIVACCIFLLPSVASAQQRSLASIVYDAVRAACADVTGVSIGDRADKNTWRISFSVTPSGCQPAAQAAMAAFAGALNTVPFSDFISRWTDPEYALLMQRRATAIAAGNVTLVKQWDIAFTTGSVDLNSPAAQNFKAAIVAAGILTQARADVIFQ